MEIISDSTFSLPRLSSTARNTISWIKSPIGTIMGPATSGYGVSIDVSLCGGKPMLATHPDIDTIAVTRAFDGIEAAAHRVISQVGGMASVIKDAKIAILKPNFVAGRSATKL